MGCCCKKKNQENAENRENLEENIVIDKEDVENNQIQNIDNRIQLNNNNEEEELEKNEFQEEDDDDDDWLRKHGKPVTKKDTSGRISLLFYGPCHSGKSQLFDYIEKYSPNETSGAYVGVAFFKKQIKIKI